MATTIGTITLDGSFTDWLAAQSLMNSANTVAGYQVYGALINDATLGENYVIGIDATGSADPVIVAGTVIYLNTDQNDSTGYSPSFASGGVGAEYEVQFAADPTTGALQAYLYSVTAAGVTTPLNGGLPLNSGFSTNKESVELAIPQSLLTPTGGTAPTAINFDVLINNATGLPTPFSTSTPQYVIPDPAAAPPPTTVANTITLDGTFTDWPAPDSVMTSGNTVAGYQVYGAFLSNTYVIGIDATNSADPVIGAGSTIYLNTDQNTATGYSPTFASGAVGAEYEVQFSYGPNSELEPFLYSITSAGVTTELNNGQPLPFGMSSNGESLELAIPQSLLTPAGGAAPTSINFAALINNTNGLPSALANNPEYIITDSAALVPVDHTIKKVGIVYSATTAALYFGGGPAGESAYSDLFMDAQHQAEAAGVSYDLLSESDLTDVAKLSQYSALIFPDFQDVQSSQVSAIANALHQVVYEYHVPIITAGDFMTNDQTGAALPATYANMQDLLNLTSAGFNNSATYSVTPDPTALNNPIMAGYTAGQLIGGASGEFAGTTKGIYTDTGYLTFAGVTQPATTLADINIQATSTAPASTVAGVVQTTTGGTNTDFATTGLFGDSNLLQHVIQNTVFGTTPSLAIDITRFKGIVNSRTDMDQSQFPDDVDPSLNNGKGIYDVLLNEPVSSVNSADSSNLSILAYLNQQYDFVGSYYINIGDNANPANNNTTNWTISTPYYDQLLQMGNEIGDHSYTHLIDPPTTTFPETTTVATLAGSPQVTVNALPSYNGATLGMTVTGTNIGPNTIVTGVSANADGTYTLTLQYLPGGFGTPNLGVTGLVPAGETLTFGVPAENTNFLSTTGTGPFTYNYEFTQSKQIEDANIGIAIAGAAVPGANDYLPDSEQILKDFPTANGLTGYVNGGWTGVGSGSPNAFGYITPSDSESVYIAPDITFDFSEVQFEGKTPESALSDWESLFNQLSSNSETPVIVWPWHDYGITDWPTNGPGTAPPGYNEALYQDFIAYAYNAGDEFVTSEDLASRIAAEQAAKLSETTSGNVITATVTPSAAEPDLGAMALNVVNGAAGQVIKNAGSWYAYDANSVFLANDTANVVNGKAAPETFTVTLGTTQDDVTHIDLLPMRADLQSVTGNGSNLTFAMTGDGTVDMHIKTPGSNIISVNMSAVGTGAGAPAAMLAGQDLKLVLNDGPLAFNTTSPQGVPVLHNVTINEGATAVVSSGAILFDVSVAYFLANKSALDVAAAIGILDSSANVLASLTGVSTNGLNDTHIASITLTDTTPPILKVTVAEVLNDATALSKIVSPHTLALADTAANIAAITSAQATALHAAGVTSIASTTGAVTMTLAEAQLLLGDGIAVTGGALTATATVAAIVALAAAQVSALAAGGYALKVFDTAANIAAITSAQATALHAAGVTSVASTTGAVTMTLAEAQLLSGDGIAVTGGATATATVAAMLALTTTQASTLTSAGYALTVLDTGANIQKLSTANVATLQSDHVTKITATSSVGLTLALATALEGTSTKPAILVSVPTGSTVTVTDTSVHLNSATAFSPIVIQNLKAIGVSSIVSSGGGAVTVNVAQTQALANAALKITASGGIDVTVSDTAANVQALTAAQITALPGIGVTTVTVSNASNLALTVAQAAAFEPVVNTVVLNSGTQNTVSDTAADIATLTATQINALSNLNVTKINATNTTANLTVAQASALSNQGIPVTAPSGSVVEISDTAANLQAMSASTIYALPDVGISRLVSNNANVAFSAAQTTSISESNLIVSASGTNSVSETLTTGAVIVSSSNGAGGGNLTLSTNSNGVTVNAGASSLNVSAGGERVPVTDYATEAITATGRTKDTFAFTHGFGQDTITGLLAGTSANHDLLQFEASAFGAGLTAANQGADLIALLSGTTNNSAGNAVITDIHGDSLTLNGISKATLALAANAVDFKFV